MSVAVLSSWLLRDCESAGITKEPDATRVVRSRTPGIETDLVIFRIIDSTLITSTAVNNSRKMLRVCSLDRLLRTFY
jgi:hypothetical protein